MKLKSLMLGASLMSVLAIIVALGATHTAVGVASCDYCKVKEIASIQSDSLDKVAVAEKAKEKMTVASDSNYKDKIKIDKVIADSFAESHKQVEKYVAIKRSTAAKDTDADITAELELDASMFKRFDQTKSSYELAANSLISNDSASVGSKQTSFNRQSSIDIACSAVTRAVVKSDKFICAACFRSEPETIKT